MTNAWWTDQETELAMQMLDRNARPAEFIEVLGRTKGAAWKRRRQVQGVKRTKAYICHSMSQKLPPPEVLDEAVRRQLAPKTLVGYLFGDPPIGFSALERR
jgi:hypothetical protein